MNYAIEAGSRHTVDRSGSGDEGLALIIALIALSLFSLLGLYMALNAATEVRISDNFESELQARAAAMAGISHARELLKGLNHNDLLTGPDGTHDARDAYMNLVRTSHALRTPLDISTARSLDLMDPVNAVSNMPDDGLISTGMVRGTPGIVLIPKTGIALTAPNPYWQGVITTARYFVKVSDNNGEASEITADALNDPFVDGDGIIIIRSLGVAQTIREAVGLTIRRNSVAIYEARFQRANPFHQLASPLAVIGSDVGVNLSGSSFSITGGHQGPGIATIDTDSSDIYRPDLILKAALEGKGSVTGNCPPIKGTPDPNCIGDITAVAGADPQMSKLMDPVWLHDFVFNQIPRFADNVWDGYGSVDLGTIQNPKVTFVNGNLNLAGSISGAGLLVVTGDLELGGTMRWDGLVMGIGSGLVRALGLNGGIYGAMIIANLSRDGGTPVFGKPILDIRGNGAIASFDGELILMAARLLPSKQIGFREITGVIDP